MNVLKTNKMSKIIGFLGDFIRKPIYLNKFVGKYPIIFIRIKYFLSQDKKKDCIFECN